MLGMTGELSVCRVHERAQIDVRVLKLGRVDRALGFDQPHRAAQVSSLVGRHGRQYPPILSIERHEVSLFHAAPYDKLIPLGVEPSVLEVEVVLIRPEPRNLIVGLALAQHASGRGRTLIQRVLPVFHADPPFEYGVVVVGHVTRRVDPLHACTTVLIDHDAVVDLRAGAGEELRNWLDAEAYHSEVALDTATALGRDPLHAVGAFKRSYRIIEDQRRPVVAVDPFYHPADLFAKDSTQRHLVALHDDDVHTRLPKRRRHLRADEAHPYHHRLTPWGDLRADALAVGHRA